MLHNGIDVRGLRQWADVIAQHPPEGAATARVRHRWREGFSVHGSPETLQLGSQRLDRTQHTLSTDWPQPFGSDGGPTPGAESVLAAVGACVATTYVVNATARGVVVDDLEVVTEGDVDLRGLLELGAGRAGFTDVRVEVAVRSEAGDEVLQELARTATRTSPAYDSLTRPVDARLSLRRLA